jgi:hypothetical protein
MMHFPKMEVDTEMDTTGATQENDKPEPATAQQG